MVSTMFGHCMLIRDSTAFTNILPTTLRDRDGCMTSIYPSTFYYPCYVKHGGAKMSYSEWRKCTLNKLAFEIASYLIDHSKSNHEYSSHPLYPPLINAMDNLKKDVDHEYDPGIIGLIIDFVNDNKGTWNRVYHEELLNENSPDILHHGIFETPVVSESTFFSAFGWNLNDQMVCYKKEVMDAMNVPSRFEIDPLCYDDGGVYSFIVHCCCLNKADELWLGLQRKSKYGFTYTYPAKTADAIVYYGGRECSNESSPFQAFVYENKKAVSKALPSWRAGDWISVEIIIQGLGMTVRFYLNGEVMKSETIETITEESDPFLLYVLVDADDDTWYIEEAFTRRGLHALPAIPRKSPKRCQLLNLPSLMLSFASGFISDKKRNAPYGPPPDLRTDYWKYMGDALECDRQTQTELVVKSRITDSDNSRTPYNSAFGATAVLRGKHIWKIQITKKYSKMCLGISSSMDTIHMNFNRNRRCPHYGYNWDGSKVSHQTKYEEYGPPIKEGQVITIILDLDKQCIEFMNGDEHLGVAFDDVVTGNAIEYRLAVSVVNKGDAVLLIGYMECGDNADSEFEGSLDAVSLSNGSSMNHDHDQESHESHDQCNGFNHYNGDHEEEEQKLNVKEMDSWNHQKCRLWMERVIHRKIDEMDGSDLRNVMERMQSENGSINEMESLQQQIQSQAMELEAAQQKIQKLKKRNSKLDKRVKATNAEKDNLLNLYSLKEEQVQVAQMENQRLRAQLLRLQKSLSGR